MFHFIVLIVLPISLIQHSAVNNHMRIMSSSSKLIINSFNGQNFCAMPASYTTMFTPSPGTLSAWSKASVQII